ncbi:MAG: hypothetical protein KDA42_17210 [Planctomycetales bacterium]|nr:hypothetical protein [Planctomycetales bacterium]
MNGILLSLAKRLSVDGQQNASAGSGDVSCEALLRLAMFLIAWLAQIATVLITWQVWQVRSRPPNLPLFSLPAWSLGPFILLSLCVVLIAPRFGVLLHGAALVVSCFFDQHRLEPQFFALWVLLWATVSARGEWFARWFLASLWFWAGLHKLLSPEFLGLTSWRICQRVGLETSWHFRLAIAVAGFEIFVALLAIRTRRAAAIGCLLLHGGILLFLSPWFYNSNVSVWPWNAATGILGAWLFLRAPASLSGNAKQLAVVAALYLVPGVYYLGWINPHMAHVLYSSHMPKAWISGHDEARSLHGWGGLAVPFPDSHALFIQAFEQTAEFGDKLYIQDPRRRIDDRYFILQGDGHAEEIDRAAFRQGDERKGEVVGLLFDDANAAFQLEQSGMQIQRNRAGQANSINSADANCDDAALARIARLPNLREVRLTGGRVSAQGLATLAVLDRLEIFSIEEMPLSDDGLNVLDAYSNLHWLGLSGTRVEGRALERLPNPEKLEVLHLARTPILSDSVALLARFENVTWLDLHGTAVDNQSVQRFVSLKKCNWLDLRETAIDDRAIDALAAMKQLEILDVRETGISSGGIARLRQALPSCRLVATDDEPE